MSDQQITVIITTIGRPTLRRAIESCGDHPTIIVSDGKDVIVPVYRSSSLSYVRLGLRHGNYGCTAWNVGCGVAKTEYVTKLDDDDEFQDGALDRMNDQVQIDPSVDIWIPGLRYKDGREVCLREGLLEVGNVACPTIKTAIAAANPIRPQSPLHLVDFNHIRNMVESGHKIRWYGFAAIAVRPNADGDYGRGN